MTKNSIAFAECDSKLLRVMNLMGIKADVIGDSINYLGSETIPVSMNYEGLKGFMMPIDIWLAKNEITKLFNKIPLLK